MHQTILTPDRLELNGVAVYIVDDPVFHQVYKVNKANEYCLEIRQAITNGKKKLGGITLRKYLIHDGILYYKQRLWVPEDIYTKLIRKVYNQLVYSQLGVYV